MTTSVALIRLLNKTTKLKQMVIVKLKIKIDRLPVDQYIIKKVITKE